MHHYPFHIGDYRKDTAQLTLLEHGIYRSLMDCYYLQETPLVSNKEKLCRLIGARSDTEKQAVSNILDDFFILRDDGYHHHGCNKVLSAIYDKSEKARIAVEKRWKKHRENTHTKNNVNTDVSKKHTDVSENDTDVSVSYPKTAKIDTDCILPNTHNPIPITQHKKQAPRRGVLNDDIFTMLCGTGLTDQQANDFIVQRKAQRAPITRSAIDRIAKQAELAGIPTSEAILMCLERGWRGFSASWVTQVAGSNKKASQVDTRGFIEASTDRSWADGFIDTHTDKKWREGL